MGIRIGLGAATLAAAGGAVAWTISHRSRDDAQSPAESFARSVEVLRDETDNAMSPTQAREMASALGDDATASDASGLAAIYSAYRGSETLGELAFERTLARTELPRDDWDDELLHARDEIEALEAADAATGEKLSDEQIASLRDTIIGRDGSPVVDGRVAGSLVQSLHDSGHGYDFALTALLESFLDTGEAIEQFDERATTYGEMVSAARAELGDGAEPRVAGELAMAIQSRYGNDLAYGTPEPSAEMATNAARAYGEFHASGASADEALTRTIDMIHGTDDDSWN